MKSYMVNVKRRIECLLACMLLLSLGVVLFVLATKLMLDIYRQFFDLLSLCMCILLLVISFAIGCFSVVNYAIQFRKYSLNDHGITIFYCGVFQTHYCWSDISQISVCDINHAPKNDMYYDVVIRIVLGVEKSGPSTISTYIIPNKYEKWRNSWYNFFNFKKILTLEYTKDRLTAVRQLSKKNILDYRTPTVAAQMGEL